MPNLDWSNLGFKVVETNTMIVSRYKDGKWSEPVSVSPTSMELNPFAGVCHYASSCFEGLKAFRGADGKVRIFRPDENAARLIRSAEYIGLTAPSAELFTDMVIRCVRENLDFLPPYGYNASMYIRPLLMGSNPQLNIVSPTETVFVVMCNPVGSYTGSGLTPTTAVLVRNYDRVAPNGTGAYKLASNYAPAFRPYNIAHEQGFTEILFTDSATHSKIDEFGSSNFIGIKNGTYVTPLSPSVLPSITNKSLRTLAEDMGIKVERRAIPIEELPEFEEVGACGTAVVITPIYSLTDKPVLEGEEVTRVHTFGEKGKCGPTLQKLYDKIRGIQDGTEEDVHNWCVII